MDGLRFRDTTVPEGELVWSFDTSGGPGGQHANRNATRVTVSFDITNSPSLPDEIRQRLTRRLGTRLADGVVRVTVDDTRSQWRNRSIARDRLTSLLDEALAPRRRRLPTKPSRAARRHRLREKRRRAEIKRLRGRPPMDE